jgi:hypothetical protein
VFSTRNYFVADAADNGAVNVYQLPEGKRILTCNPADGAGGNTRTVEWIDGDTRLLIRNPETVELWDISPTLAALTPAPPPAVAARTTLDRWVSPDGTITRTLSAVIQPEYLVDLIIEERGATTRLLRTLETGLRQEGVDNRLRFYRFSTRFSADGKVVFALGSVPGTDDSDGVLRAWETETGRRLAIPGNAAGVPVPVPRRRRWRDPP